MVYLNAVHIIAILAIGKELGNISKSMLSIARITIRLQGLFQNFMQQSAAEHYFLQNLHQQISKSQ